MKKFTYILLLLLVAGATQAQDIIGDWYGTLQFPGGKLRIVYHIDKNGDNYSTTLDSPDQGAKGIPADKTTFSDRVLTMELAKIAVKYSGTLTPDSSRIEGNFTQNGMVIPLILTRKELIADAKPSPRLQDPKDFPYRQEEVTFVNPKAGNTLGGTLTIPSSGKVKRIVILISGSGLQNRNEELFNHRPFLVLSDWLTRQGIAVLRYDDRGVGKSVSPPGMSGKATTADFADDTEAAVTYIRSRADLKSLSLGLIGHSEGGVIAPIVAARNPAVKFIVLLAGPGIPSAELMKQQITDDLRLNGMAAENISLIVGSNAKVFDLITQHPDLGPEKLNAKIDTLLYKEISQYPKPLLGGSTVDELVLISRARLNTPWFQYFIRMDPSVYLKKVKCPVLALNGTLDMQVKSSPNLDGIRNSLQSANNKSIEIVPLEGLNHLFQKAKTGAVAEYVQIEETTNPVALEKISTWVNAL